MYYPLKMLYKANILAINYIYLLFILLNNKNQSDLEQHQLVEEEDVLLDLQLLVVDALGRLLYAETILNKIVHNFSQGQGGSFRKNNIRTKSTK